MGAFFSAIFGVWLIGAFFSSPYFWAKRTDRTAAPIVRRFMALGYGFGWPYFLVKFFMDRNEKKAGESARAAKAQRILGDGPSPSSGPAGGPSTAPPPIKDPFENR